MIISRSQIATLAHRIGLTRILSALARKPCLIVLCYHRIGIAGQTRHDPDVYSATPDELYEQVSYLKSTYGIVTLEESIDGFPALVRNRPRVLLTFDDGYLDNYTTAYPILRSLGVQGSFFLPTGFLGTNHVPWWDAVCNMIWRTPQRRLRIPCLTSEVFDKNENGPVAVMRAILRLYRGTNSSDPSQLLAELSETCQVAPPVPSPQRRFLNWEEAREMLRGGMAMGSHSHSHALLGGLPLSEQRDEVVGSRQMMAEQLHVNPRAFALPCGSCSPESRSVLAEAGYEMSFSTEYGVNCVSSWDPLNVRRILVNRDDVKESTRLKLALMAGFVPSSTLVTI